ncbi:MAG: xanthine dehydrogenase family protein subunit M [Alphaproteobacteria bacterium]|nr:xanthine dehydrogenase family protein subunit M [Alphaproteobacteria bacterium]
MKPAPFAYHAPRSLADAVRLLAELGDDAKVLAGGQSLIAAMNFRLARPAALVDINRIAGLDYVKNEGGTLRIGALARHARFERPLVEGVLGGLLPYVARHIAHLPIRSRGTFAGSLAHADPASEWCLVARTLDAEIVLTGPKAERRVPAADYFQGVFTTALKPDEIVGEVRVPLPGAGWRGGFAEFSRRAGDFALAMCLALIRIEGGRIAEAKLGIGGGADRPLRIAAAERALIGHAPDPDAFAAAADIAAREVDPMSDIHADADYRRDLVGAMTRRALAHALQA